MADRILPQRELRNNIGAILREAEAGTAFTVTVRGRPVASLGPPNRARGRSVDVDVRALQAILAGAPVDDQFLPDIEAIRRGEEPLDSPWLDL